MRNGAGSYEIHQAMLFLTKRCFYFLWHCSLAVDTLPTITRVRSLRLRLLQFNNSSKSLMTQQQPFPLRLSFTSFCFLTHTHTGNRRFRDIVALYRPDYVRAHKVQKPAVARVVVRAIRNGNPPGRFLRKDESTGRWIDVGTFSNCNGCGRLFCKG